MKNTSPWIWIVFLALVSVAYQFFQPGLSGDAPLYAFISRTMVETGDFWRMESGLPEFQPFAEHPHLGFWVHALLFKIFAASDWSYRLVGILFYCGSLGVFYRLVSKKDGENTAIWAVCLLWTWPLFSKFYANSYLDAGFLFFGLFSLERFLAEQIKKAGWKSGICCGLLLGLAILYKGIVGFVFFPLFLFLAFRSKQLAKFALLLLFSLIPLGLYYLLLKSNGYSEFFTQYLESVRRRSTGYSFSELLNLKVYLSLIKETHALILILPLWAILRKQFSSSLRWIPLAWFFLFFIPYILTGRWGFQYWTSIMPALAWSLSLFFPKNWKSQALTVKATTIIACLLLFPLLQIWPKPLRAPPSDFLLEARQIQERYNLRSFSISKGHKIAEDFSYSGRILWYSHFEEGLYHQPGEEIPVAKQNHAFIVFGKDQNSLSEKLQQQGYCRKIQLQERSLWIACRRQLASSKFFR